MWQCLEIFLIATTGVGVRGRDCYWPGMLLNILQPTGSCPEQRIIWPTISVVCRLRNPALKAAQRIPAPATTSLLCSISAALTFQGSNSGCGLLRRLSPGVHPIAVLRPGAPSDSVDLETSWAESWKGLGILQVDWLWSLWFRPYLPRLPESPGVMLTLSEASFMPDRLPFFLFSLAHQIF